MERYSHAQRRIRSQRLANANRAAIHGNKLRLMFGGAGSVSDGSPKPEKRKKHSLGVLGENTERGFKYGKRLACGMFVLSRRFLR